MPRYSIAALPGLIYPHGIGPDGTVVGYILPRPRQYGTAVVYRGGTIHALPQLAAVARGSQAMAVNGAGTIVGSAPSAVGASHATIFSTAHAHDAGTLYGHASALVDINEVGVAVGWTTAPVQRSARELHHRAVLYDGHALRDLGTLGSSYSSASAINNRGEVVGYAEDAAGVARAFLYRLATGAIVALGTPTATGYSSAHDINDHGQVVGSARLPDGAERAILFEGGAIRVLGHLGGQGSMATAINNSGLVIGHEWWALPPLARRPQRQTRGVLWVGGEPVALEDLLDNGDDWEVRYPTDLNDMGQIAGQGRFQGQVTAFLLTPHE